MKKILFICGVSGSGKTYIAKGLEQIHPNVFYKPKQCTTRKMRDEETKDDYFFIDKNKYNTIKDNLFAKTNVNNNLYGTNIDLIRKEGTAILVVNALGLNDGIKYCKKNNILCNILYISNMNDDIVRDDIRDKNKEKLELEKELKKYNHYTVYQDKDNYINIHGLYKYLVNLKIGI